MNVGVSLVVFTSTFHSELGTMKKYWQQVSTSKKVQRFGEKQKTGRNCGWFASCIDVIIHSDPFTDDAEILFMPTSLQFSLFIMQRSTLCSKLFKAFHFETSFASYLSPFSLSFCLQHRVSKEDVTFSTKQEVLNF